MRIAMFAETFLPKVDGVVTRVTRTLEALAAQGHEVLVFAPHRPPPTFAGHRVVRMPAVPFRPWYPELFLGLPRPRMGRELDAFEPDLVHVVNPVVLGLWGTMVARQRDLPLLASFHTDLTQYTVHHRLAFLGPLSRRFLRDVHNLAHVNLCTSRPMVNTARGLGIRRVRLWPKAVDTHRFHPSRASAAMRARLSGGDVDAPLILYVGRLSAEKRLDWLYAPVTQIDGARLAFVGSGPAEAHLKRRFAGTRTVFTGYLSGDDLAAAYASADVFAFPSDTETLGFGAMESMASGVCVVGARAGGLPDVIDHGTTGLLFTPGDLGDLTAQLRRLIVDGELRWSMAAAARREMEACTWDAATASLVRSYRLARAVHARFDLPGDDRGAATGSGGDGVAYERPQILGRTTGTSKSERTSTSTP